MNRRRTFKYPEPGCEHVLNDPRFKSEETLVSPWRGLVTKPLAVERNFLARARLGRQRPKLSEACRRREAM